MRLGVDFRGDGPDSLIQFGKQMGAEDAVGSAASFDPVRGYFDYETLVELKERVEGFGLKLAAIENVHRHWNDKIKLGLPGRDEQIDNWCKSLRNMGKAGSSDLRIQFHDPKQSDDLLLEDLQNAYGPGRSGRHYVRLGGCQGGAGRRARRVLRRRHLGQLRLLHQGRRSRCRGSRRQDGVASRRPSDLSLAGIARIFRSHDSLQRLCDTVQSDYNGLEFCQGTVSEMPENVIDAIERFVGQGKVHYVHFRNVSGPVPTFSETFIDEGHVDMIEAMETYHKLASRARSSTTMSPASSATANATSPALTPWATSAP